MADAAIIIPHYNDTERLSRCLQALHPQLLPSIELVVVDNASLSDLTPVRMAHPNVRIVVEPRKGAAEARNRGVRETSAERLFFLDCDCVPASDWLATALRLADQADVIGGRISVFDETPPPRNGAQAFEAVFAFDNRTYVQEKGFSVTANLLTRRDVFNATGQFIAGLSEDLDWCRRATAKGFSLVYEDSLSVAHPSRSDWAALSGKWRRLTKESYGVNGAGPLDRVRWALRAIAMPVSILAHAPRILFSTALRDRRERVAALGTLARLRMLRSMWMLKQAVGMAI
jgi:GT2 family glycosyltransferase